jgi:hypothetical protein
MKELFKEKLCNACNARQSQEELQTHYPTLSRTRTTSVNSIMNAFKKN